MSPLDELPPDVRATIVGSPIVEFATLTRSGVPLDTPLLTFVDDERGLVSVTTGLAYPAKAERARRNAKVGLLFEGQEGSGAPLVSASAYAAVRDADIQANTDRYIAASAPMVSSIAFGCSRDQVRSAVWYWSRIWIECTLVRVRWWPSADHAGPVAEWRSVDPPEIPESDPTPAGAMSAAPSGGPVPWRTRASEVLPLVPRPHLTAVDSEGFPIPVRVTSAELDDDGFRLGMPPANLCGELAGPASLCFGMFALFVGAVSQTNETTAFFQVERVLPENPIVRDPREIFAPSAATRDALMARLEHELRRRGQPMPTISGDAFASIDSLGT